MKKNHLISMLGALIIASSAFACAEEPPEDRIINVIETIYDKVDKADDCAVLAKDLDAYCADASSELKNSFKDLLNVNSAEAAMKLIEKIQKIGESMAKLDKIENSKCANDPMVEKALDPCFEALEFDDGDL